MNHVGVDVGRIVCKLSINVGLQPSCKGQRFREFLRKGSGTSTCPAWMPTPEARPLCCAVLMVLLVLPDQQTSLTSTHEMNLNTCYTVIQFSKR